MANAFIIHGTAGYPEENWFPWLKKELESLGYNVIVPQFPTPENQTPENWFKVLEKYRERIGPDTIIIGHSLGGAFVLRVLEKSNVRIKAAFLVAAPVGVLPIRNYEGDRPFIGKPFDWAAIRKNCGKFFVFHSDTDPFVSLGNGEELAKNLGVNLIFVKNAGHFNAKAGYTKFDALLELMKKEL